MRKQALVELKKELARFQERFDVVWKLQESDKMGESPLFLWGCAETAAMRRASLDLTRALAQLRKP